MDVYSVIRVTTSSIHIKKNIALICTRDYDFFWSAVTSIFWSLPYNTHDTEIRRFEKDITTGSRHCHLTECDDFPEGDEDFPFAFTRERLICQRYYEFTYRRCRSRRLQWSRPEVSDISRTDTNFVDMQKIYTTHFHDNLRNLYDIRWTIR